MSEEFKVVVSIPIIETLIKKVSDATGILYEPTKIKRKAKADADALTTLATAGIEVTDLEHRAMSRLVKEEAKKQENIESVMNKAIPQLEDGAEPNGLNDDWVMHYFDKVKNISDENAQKVWARLLAGEVNRPNSFSKHTINVLYLLDPSDVKIFENLMRFTWTQSGRCHPLIFDETLDIYASNGINFEKLMHLDKLGLIQYSGAGFRLSSSDKMQLLDFFYFSRKLQLRVSNEDSFNLSIGRVGLTQVGAEMMKLVTGVLEVDDYYEFVKNIWKKHLVSMEYQK